MQEDNTPQVNQTPQFTGGNKWNLNQGNKNNIILGQKKGSGKGNNVFKPGPAYGEPQITETARGVEMSDRRHMNPNPPTDNFNLPTNDGHDSLPSSLNLSSKKVKMGFIRKVYGILTFQLGITAGFIIFAAMYSKYQEFLMSHKYLLILSVILYFAIVICLFCFPKTARIVPLNYILMIILTLAMSLMTTCSTVQQDWKTLVLAGSLTFVLVLSLSAYAFYAKTDFTTMGGTLFCFSMILIFASILQFFLHILWLRWVITLFGFGLGCLYLIYDTQLIVGGKTKRALQLSTDDYILGAVMLYIDIIILFLRILQMFGKK